MIKIITIIGARPQFIKAAAVSNAFKEHFEEIIVHTGQHYDSNMSDVFFSELNIPKPKYQLNIGSSSHGAQTGAMLAAIEELLQAEKPNLVMVYGDTNSTLAGALAASKLLIPVIHVEAGLRSFNKAMPEEQNRILTDHISELLFVPTQTAVTNLKNEGLTSGVHNVGDVMYDGILRFTEIAKSKSSILEANGLVDGDYLLCTIHRAENTNDPKRLTEIVNGLNAVNEPIVLPLHPRTVGFMAEYGLKLSSHIKVIEPVGYLDMIRLEAGAKKIVTDSGGVQKEAFFLGIPCITLRDETEWTETVENGWNVLVGADASKIIEQINSFKPIQERIDYFGDGDSVAKMIKIIKNFAAEKVASQ